MLDTQIVLLPGLDGTARLFSRFIAAGPNRLRLVPVPLPPEPLRYDELAERIIDKLPAGRLVAVAESFSGPLAIAIAARRPPVLLRRYMVGELADNALVREVAAVVASVPSAILASRLRSVLSLDSSDAFARCTVPTLYLRGADDRLVPDSACRTMAALREMEIARVHGPHLLLQANPAVAWKAILPFIES